MSHQQQLENKKYRNWVKAGLGLKYLKEGLEPFTDNIVRQQHTDILNTVKRVCNVTAVNCGQCNLKTLQPNHVRTGNGICPLGQPGCNCLYPRGKSVCTNSNICGVMYDAIVNLHNSVPPAPCWKNSDVKKWCTDPWSVAKCFINAQGYAQKTSAAEIDCSGLLHVAINNKGFHSHTQCVISGHDVFCKTRQARNTIFHSMSMELEDAEVINYIDNMIAILEDGKELYARPESIDAVQKLQEIKSDAFIITKETETDLMKTVQFAIDQKGKELEQRIATAIENIDSKSKEGRETQEHVKAEILETAKSTEKLIADKTRDAVDKIQTLETLFTQKTKDSLDEHKSYLLSNTEEHIDQIKTAGEATLRKIRKAIMLPTIEETIYSNRELEDDSEVELNVSSKNRQHNYMTTQQHNYMTTHETLYSRIKYQQQHYGEDYERRKQALQTQLSVLYQSHYLNISSSPLTCHESDISIHEVYIPPNMEIRELGNNGVPHTETVNSYRQIFYKRMREMKNIYILGEVGTGKSSFCKMMMHNWREAISPSSEKEQNPDDKMLPEKINIETMKKFDFLFFLPLRHLSGYSDSLFDMITVSYRNILHEEFLKDLVDKESTRCLILADGLDEWMAPGGPTLPHTSHCKPTRENLKHATVITMSRPSARGILSMKSSDCDLRIELLGVEEQSIALLIEKYMRKMEVNDRTTARFFEKISGKTLQHLETMPMMLQHLLWVYCNEGEIGRTRSEIYSSIVNILLRWSEEKHYQIPANIASVELPDCLKRYRTCNENKYILYALGEIAFSTIQSTSKSAVSFGRSKLNKIGLTKDQVAFILNVGLLTEEKAFDLTNETTRFAFSHTSFLEYFAAVFIVMNADAEENGKTLDVFFGACACVADVLKNADLIKTVCGLSPNMITEISTHIKKVTNHDSIFMKYRQEMKKSQLHHFKEKDLPEKIQLLVSECLTESVMNDANKLNVPGVKLADVYVDKNTEDTFLHELDPEHVVSLYVYSLFNEEKMLSDNTLRIIGGFHLLKSLHIDFVCLQHEHCDVLSKFLSETVTLSHVILHDLKCKLKCKEQHVIDLSGHEYLETFCLHLNESFMLAGLDTTRLESCTLHSVEVFSQFLKNAPKLKFLTLCGSPGKYLLINEELRSMIKSLKCLEVFKRPFTVDI